MLWNSALQDVLHVVILLAGGILLFKKVAEMDRYHSLRVWVLTSVLSCIVIYFFLAFGFMSGWLFTFDDCLDFSGNSTNFY